MATPFRKPRNNPRRKAKRQGEFSGNHQRSWLYGFHAVTETLQAGKWPILELYANEAAEVQSRELLRAQQTAGIPVEVVSNERLTELSKSTEHQGLVARLGRFPYQSMSDLQQLLQQSIDSLASQAGKHGLQPLVVICDRIQDTFNFGAILRCCDGANALAVIVGDHCQAEVTPHVARSSSGAVNYIPIIKAPDLVGAAELVKASGLQLVAADSNTSNSVWQTPLCQANALVIGSESLGIRPELSAICDQHVCIPMQGQVTSLNAAVAAGILLYEIRRQQSS